MRVKAVDHVQVAMPPGREEEARAFYGEILGIPEVRKPANLAGRGGTWFENGELRVHRVHVGVEAGFRPNRKAHPAFLVEDLDELRAALAAAGYRIKEAEPLKGYKRCYTEDPFGKRIELLERVQD